jgi:uncharacterized integral membrane protein
MAEPAGRHYPPAEEPPPRRPPRHRSSRAAQMNWAPLAVVALVVIGALIFVVQNHQRVQFSYLSVRVNAPLWLAIVGYVVFGMAIGALLMYWRQRPRE